MVHELVQCRFCGCELTSTNIIKQSSKVIRKECKRCRENINKLFKQPKKNNYWDRFKSFCLKMLEKRYGSK